VDTFDQIIEEEAMGWDSWEETQRKNEEHRKRVEADRQTREKRIADDKKRLSEEATNAKEKKKIDLKKKNEREDKQRKRIEQSNASYEELLNGSKKEEKKPQVSLNKFSGVRSGGFQGGFGQAGRINQPVGGPSLQGGGAIKSSGHQFAQQTAQDKCNKVVSSAILSGLRRF
jgi:hypothetical protein